MAGSSPNLVSLSELDIRLNSSNRVGLQLQQFSAQGLIQVPKANTANRGSNRQRSMSPSSLPTRIDYNCIDDIPFVDLTLDGNVESWKDTSLSMLQSLVPQWFSSNTTDLSSSSLEFKTFTEGLTNKLVSVTNTNTNERLMIRAYGLSSEIFINRNNELANFVSLNRQSLAPPVFGRFNNGLVYGFVPGRPLSPDDMCNPSIYPLVARTMAQWHHLPLIINADHDSVKSTSHGTSESRDHVDLADKAAHDDSRRNLAALNTETSSLFALLTAMNPQPNDHFQNPTYSLDSPIVEQINTWLLVLVEKNANTFGFSIDQLRQTLHRLDEQLMRNDRRQSPLVFCHNDLLGGNLIYEKSAETVAFIDFEYGGYNQRGFDLGNHFCEWAGNDCEYHARYPSLQVQRTFIRAYLQYYVDMHVLDMQTDLTDDSLIDQLVVEANAFSLLANLYWGVWGLVQNHISLIDFDYATFAKARLHRLYETMDHFLSPYIS